MESGGPPAARLLLVWLFERQMCTPDTAAVKCSVCAAHTAAAVGKKAAVLFHREIQKLAVRQRSAGSAVAQECESVLRQRNGAAAVPMPASFSTAPMHAVKIHFFTTTHVPLLELERDGLQRL